MQQQEHQTWIIYVHIFDLEDDDNLDEDNEEDDCVYDDVYVICELITLRH